MYILQLNDIRSSQIELLTAVARADSVEELEQFMGAEKVEYYHDGHWGKAFKKDGVLEWCNPPFDINEAIINVGSAESWAEQAMMDFENRVMVLPSVGV